MLIKKFPVVAVAAALLACASQAAVAQAIPIPEDADFVVQVDLEAARDTDLGAKLIEAAQLFAAEEMDDDINADQAFKRIKQALGFDPFHEPRSVTVVGHDLSDPLEGLQVVIGMGETTGNLEGLLLALPGYESAKHGDWLIHSVAPDDDVRIFGAVHDGRSKHVVIATDAGDVERMLDVLDGRQSASASDGRRESSHKPGAFLTAWLNEIPDLDELDGSPRTFAQLLSQVSGSIREYKGSLQLELGLTTVDEQRAEQLQQLGQGLTAMIALVAESEDADDELAMFAEFLEDLHVERDGKTIRLELELPEDLILEFLREEVDLPLPR